MVGLAPAAVGDIRVVRVAELDTGRADDGAGDGLRGERAAVRLGGQAAGGLRRDGRVRRRVAAGRVRGNDEEGEEGAGDTRVGAAGGDSPARVDGRVSEPLRVEFDAGGLDPRGADHRVAAGGGTVL